MTREEAILYLTPIAESASLERYKEALSMAVAALREQEERESVWHDAKDIPPQKPGLYYGKRDDTDSMYLCQYRDGVWTLDAYPETRMHVIKWAYYNAFVQDREERRWIPVEKRLPEKYQTVVGWCKDNPFSKYTEEIVCWNGKGWVFLYAQRYVTNVTHWMSLPEPPKVEW